MRAPAKLIFLCGKMAAGKSTLARTLARQENAILLAQDELLDRLFPGEITDIPGYVKFSSRLNEALAPHICALLSKVSLWYSTFPATQKRSAPGFASCSRARMPSLNCISWTRRMPWADVNLMIEARTFLRAPSGQQMQSSKRSPSISSLPQRRKASTSSITSTPNHTLVPPAKSLRALVSSRGSAAAQREGYRDERIGKEER